MTVVSSRTLPAIWVDGFAIFDRFCQRRRFRQPELAREAQRLVCQSARHVPTDLRSQPVARLLSGKAAWDEMKENGLRATTAAKGGARVAAAALALVLWTVFFWLPARVDSTAVEQSTPVASAPAIAGRC